MVHVSHFLMTIKKSLKLKYVFELLDIGTTRKNKLKHTHLLTNLKIIGVFRFFLRNIIRFAQKRKCTNMNEHKRLQICQRREKYLYDLWSSLTQVLYWNGQLCHVNKRKIIFFTVRVHARICCYLQILNIFCKLHTF